MNDVMVSVCCTVYNHEKYLRECLDGFVMQKCNFKFEVVVHDDVSTDSSVDIINEYKNKYPELFRTILQTENQYSQGIDIWLSIVFPACRGKYIAICEGDDYWTDPYKLQKQYDALENFSECGICVHRVNAITEKGELLNRYYPDIKLSRGVISGDKLVEIACMARYELQTTSYFFRNEIVKKYINPIPEFTSVAVSSDTPLLLFFGQCSNAFYIDETMSHYRKASLSSLERSKNFANNYEKTIEHYNHQIEMMKKFDDYTNGKYHKLCNSKIDAYRFSTAWYFNDYERMAKLKYHKFMKLNKFGFKGQLKVYLMAILFKVKKLKRKVINES